MEKTISLQELIEIKKNYQTQQRNAANTAIAIEGAIQCVDSLIKLAMSQPEQTPPKSDPI
jgi:hypothetical protein